MEAKAGTPSLAEARPELAAEEDATPATVAPAARIARVCTSPMKPPPTTPATTARCPVRGVWSVAGDVVVGVT
ncbi:hypothetical protein GCM10025782_20060 [Pedococcus ginsenosidimutans]|uniref:Uncharacterized protein n=1 Tax=Pedococcus ginsenosidimutans TaxID=490570 RepID=A0ABP8Y7Z7_9MICO